MDKLTMIINVTVNGMKKEIEIAPGDMLLDILRKEGYYGVKKGCGKGECGACTVLVNNEARKSCLIFAAQMGGKKITTIEGIGHPDKLDPLQEAFVKTGAVQCGFCTPGMILSARALLGKNPNPTEEEIKKALDGNLCRCTGYIKPIEAVKVAARNELKAKDKRPPAN